MTNKISPDFVYYDLTTSNSLAVSNESTLKFLETRSSNFINIASDYTMSITRFTLDTTSLPVFIPTITPSQNNPNLTVYSLTLEYENAGVKTSSDQTYVIWTPVNMNLDVPQPPSTNVGGTQSISNYYYSYNYHHIATLLNNTLTQALTQLKTLVPAIATANIFTSWNNESECLEIYGTSNFFDSSVVSGKIKLFFNRALFALFTSLPSLRFHNGQIGKIYQILISSNNGTNTVVNSQIFGGVPTNVLSQEYSTISNISPITSIVFTSNMLPILQNQMSNPFVYRDGELIQTNQTTSNFSNVITDISSDSNYKPHLYMTPSAEFRRLTLISNAPINVVDISVFFKNRFGDLIPIDFWNGMSCTLKIMFEKTEEARKRDAQLP